MNIENSFLYVSFTNDGTTIDKGVFRLLFTQ